MKIRKLHATFGRLQNAELVLQDGLNVFELPNEGGKSTWSAFLLAMFYGIETSERASKGNLPAKTRYKPWSGAPMSGVMELEWQGRHITIERTSNRTPLGVFRAYDTDTGEPVPELTAETCGRTLLGVERSVFERSAFLRQSAMAVSQDNALEARLHALVTTGDERTSLSAAEKRLKEQYNHLARARSGLLPQVQTELDALTRQREALCALKQEVFSLTAKQAELRQLQGNAAGDLSTAQARQAAEQLQQLQKAAETAEAARKAADEAAEAARDLPEEATLAELEQLVYAVPPAPEPFRMAEPASPAMPEIFRGLDEAGIQRQLDEDLRIFDAADEVQKPSPLLLILAAVFAVLGVAAAFFYLPAALGLILCATVFGFFGMKKFRAAIDEENRRIAARTEVQIRYGTTEREDICALARQSQESLTRCREERIAYDAARAAHTAAQTAHDAAAAAAESRLQPRFSLSDARQTLPAARLLVRRREETAEDAADAEQYYVNLKAAYGFIDPALAAKAPASAMDLRRAEQQLAAANDALNAVSNRLERCRGQLTAQGDPDELETRAEQLEERRESLQLHIAALETAMAALKEAGAEVQTRISPALNQRAGELLSRLTDGRYDRVLLEGSFAASARLSGEAVQRELGYLSAGTADQLYLALRLAICELALPEDAPLVLDDALLTFDEQRCRTALRLLQEKADERQILLFTCQSRENRLLRDDIG